MKRRQTGNFAWRRLLDHLEPRLFLTAVPTVNLTAPKATATELNGMTTGAGTFKLTRSGPTTLPLTVHYTLDAASTALNGTDFNSSNALTGTAVIAAGSASTLITINPLDTGLADGPKKVLLDLVTAGTAPDYKLGSKKATVTIVDHAPTITLTASKASASEINGTTTGAGVFTFKRSGSTAGPLTVHFDVAGGTGAATEGTDYTALSSHTVNFTAGQTTATVTINPIDDLLTEGKETVKLTLAGDGTPASYHFKAATATVNIADDTRPIFLGAIAPLAGALQNTAFNISYNDLIAATGVRDHAGLPVSFKITAIKSGTLQRNSAPALAGKSVVSSLDSLTWSPKTNVTGSIAAFTIVATDGHHSTPAVTLNVLVLAPVAAIPHPDVMQVMPAALDQPQINAIVYVGNNTVPQVGTTSTIDPLTLDDTTVNTFNVTGFLDTGASSILISNPTNTIVNVPLLQSGGLPVIYSDVGVAGSDNFQVSGNVRLSLASSYQRTDLDQFSDAAQTQPITTPYTPIPAPNDSLRVQVGPFVPTVDNPVTDEFSDIFSDLSAVDVIGMPSMLGRVTVIDPTRVNNFGTVLDTLLSDPDNADLSALDADMSVHSFIYAPGTPFHPTTTDTDPGIPATDLHVKLSYASFDRFTQVTPTGQPGPTLAHNPFIGEDPVRLQDGTSQPDTPGITVTRSIAVPDGSGGTTQQTLTSQGNWLLDTGAAATIISTAQAAKLKVTVTHQTDGEGNDNPILVDQDGNPLPNQFQLAIGGIGGQETLAGFYLDSLTVPTQEGSGTDLANANNLHFTHEPVLVGDITVKDPTTGQTLTLDGIFGMNNLIASADFSLDAEGNIGDFNAATGYFKWITFDEPNGILGLSYDPAALAATPANLTPAVITTLSRPATTPTTTSLTAASSSILAVGDPASPAVPPTNQAIDLVNLAPVASADASAETIVPSSQETLTTPTAAALTPETPVTADPILVSVGSTTIPATGPLLATLTL